MTPDEISTLKPGDRIQWIGAPAGDPSPPLTLDRRKTDGSGWWLTDGGGVADYVLADEEWRVLEDGVTLAVVARLFGLEPEELARFVEEDPASIVARAARREREDAARLVGSVGDRLLLGSALEKMLRGEEYVFAGQGATGDRHVTLDGSWQVGDEPGDLTPAEFAAIVRAGSITVEAGS